MVAIAFPYNAAGVVGASSDMQQQNVITMIASGVGAAANTKIGFGQPVIRGTQPKTIVPLVTTGTVIGITLGRGDVDPAEGYQNGDNVPVINEGQVWVATSGAVTAGSVPLFVPSTGTFVNATTGDEPLAIKGAVFEYAAPSGGVARIQLNTRVK